MHIIFKHVVLTILPSKRMQTDPPAGVSASPIADNVMTWYALIIARMTWGSDVAHREIFL